MVRTGPTYLKAAKSLGFLGRAAKPGLDEDS